MEKEGDRGQGQPLPQPLQHNKTQLNSFKFSPLTPKNMPSPQASYPQPFKTNENK